VLVLEDGTVFRGRGLGAFGQTLGEVCFNTSMTGYQAMPSQSATDGEVEAPDYSHHENAAFRQCPIKKTAGRNNFDARTGVRAVSNRSYLGSPAAKEIPPCSCLYSR
jgi:hypothetical protein